MVFWVVVCIKERRWESWRAPCLEGREEAVSGVRLVICTVGNCPYAKCSVSIPWWAGGVGGRDLRRVTNSCRDNHEPVSVQV